MTTEFREIKTFTEEEVTKHLEDIVLEFGANYKYPDKKENPEYWSSDICVYVTTTGKPACIVGQLYSRLGASTEDLQGTMAAEAKAINLDFKFPSKVTSGLRQAQFAQDKGGTWGEALDAYKNSVFENTSAQFEV